MSSRFISLGSGQILPWESHPDLSLIHQLKLFNFPIPNGLVFLSAEKIIPTDLQELESELSAREFNQDLEVQAFVSGKSSLVVTDYTSFNDLKSCLNLLLEKLFNSLNSSDVRVDLLILENVTGTVSGSAVSQLGFCNDRINFTIKSPSNDLNPMSLQIEKIALGERKIRGDFRGRVQDLLRSIRRALGEDDWKINWVDNGSEIFLISIKKWSPEKSSSDLFVRIPFFELFKDQPYRLEQSLIQRISPKLFQYFLHWSKELSSERPFVQIENPHILFNYSLLRDFLISFGLSTAPTQLLNLKETLPSSLFNSVRFWRNLPRLVRFLHDLSLAPGLANRLARKISKFETGAEKSFTELFAEWQALYVSSSQALYRLWGKIYVNSFIPSRVYQNRALLAEKFLRQETLQGLSQVRQAIELKALGWYSRGILSSEKAIWDLSKEEVLALEEKQYR